MNLGNHSTEFDICRICRSEATPDKPLYHPCICHGSIKHIHQDCLVQWLKISKKEFCELCNHKFSFSPVYRSDMPSRLPAKDLFYGLLGNFMIAIKYWLHYSIVGIGWLVIVPSLSYRVIKCLFNGSFHSLFALPIDISAYDKLITEEIYGAISVMITVTTVIGIIWLREFIISEIPEWSENDTNNETQHIENNAVNNQVQNDQIQQRPQDVQLNNNNLNIINANNVVNFIVADDAMDRQENNEIVAAQDDVNEWDRQNEEISFERIFGLDGSLLFLEHIFWVISLNAFFVFIFAFCPYHIGLFCLSKFDLFFGFYDGESNKLEKVEIFLVTFIGYLIICVLLALLYYLLFRFSTARRLLGIGYLTIKVGIVTVLEIGLFPIFCGWLLDIFSLSLFGATIQDREAYFKSSPGFSTFIHWCLGFVYIIYITSFLRVLKDILRPSLILFIERLNNPDFSPIREIIHLSVFHILRRYIMYLIVFVPLIFVMVFLPVKTTEKLFNDFLPYNMFMSNENKTQDTSDLSMELWRLHILAPILYDYSSLITFLKSLIQNMCIFFAYILDLKSYLLKPEERVDESIEENQNGNDEIPNNNENLLNSEDNNFDNNEEHPPRYLYLRLFGLMNLVFLAIFMFGFLTITIPTFIGRKAIAIFINEQVAELYTISCGLYIMISSIKIIKWLPKDFQEIKNKIKNTILMFLKSIVAASLLCGFLPLLIGFVFEVMIFVPIRVSSNQTPIYYLTQDWLLGIILIKVFVLLALFNEWNLREALEEFYQAGFVNIDLKNLIIKFVSPIFFVAGFLLSIPYVFVYGLLPYLGFSYQSLDVILRKMYLSIWILAAAAYLLNWQFKKFRKLYEHIRNEKYLVGKKLLNFDGNQKTEPAKPIALLE